MQSAIMSLIKSIANKCALKSSLFSIIILAVINTAAAQSPTNAPFNINSFEDWLLNCKSVNDTVNDTNSPLSVECSMSQNIQFEDNSEPLLRIDLLLNPKMTAPEAIFILPLGIPLTTAPVLSFNKSGDRRTLKISHCHNDGCYFKLPLSTELLENFLSMSSAKIKLNGDDNEAIKIPISGKGSRSAYNYYKTLPTE